MAKKLRRKDLKGPDEFIGTTQRVLDYVRENPGQVSLAAGGLILMLVLALGVRAYRDWQATRAGEAFSDAYRVLSAGDLDEGVAALRRVSEEWAGVRDAALAQAYAANGYLELGRDDDAKAAFERLLEMTREPTLRQIALYNLGLLAREASDRERAEKHLREATAIDGPLRGASWVAVTFLAEGSLAPDEPIPQGIPEGVRDYLQAGRSG
jgi:tetratricopeptide (TPR) repeat protein